MASNTTRWHVPFDEIEPLPTGSSIMAKYIWQEYPFLLKFVTPFEREFTGVATVQAWWKAYPWMAVVLCGGYVLSIFLGQKIMARYKPFDLRGPLAYWNLFLCVFSLIGAVRTVPYLFWWLHHIGLKDLTCFDPFVTQGGRDIGLWVLLFNLSKMFEFFDTAFIVLRKKPLLFLHWYHHVTVASYCYAASIFNCGGLVFVAMNYSVHAIMYGYFYLAAINSVPKWFNPMWITAFQIGQMFVGVYVGVMQAIWTFNNECEAGNKYVAMGGLAMYGSYTYLFLEFFVQRFILAPRRRRLAKQQQQKKVSRGRRRRRRRRRRQPP